MYDRDHLVSVEALRRPDLKLAIPTMVVAEVAYFLGKQRGADVEAAFIERLAGLDTDLMITLDRRHFTAIQPRHCPAFRLLPS